MEDVDIVKTAPIMFENNFEEETKIMRKEFAAFIWMHTQMSSRLQEMVRSKVFGELSESELVLKTLRKRENEIKQDFPGLHLYSPQSIEGETYIDEDGGYCEEYEHGEGEMDYTGNNIVDIREFMNRKRGRNR